LNSKKKALIFSLLLLSSAFSLPAITLVQSQGETLFHITLIVPGPNPARKAWAEVVEKSLDDAGIDADRVELDWDTVYARVLDPNASVVGKVYDDGGFDALFVGYALGIDPNPFELYHSSMMPPGQNYYLWDNSENDRLCSLIKETVKEDTRLGYVKEWQQLALTEQPSATLMYTQEVIAYDPTALVGEPFQAYHYPVWPGVEKWKLNPSTTQTDIVLAQTGPAPVEGLNPWLTTSYYDLTVWAAVFDGLAEREDTIDKKMVPALAESWSVAEDGTTWTVNLRHGVKWHDGVEFTADDVLFTYEKVMDDELASPNGPFLQDVIGGIDNIEKVDDYTVIFHLPKPFAYFVESILARTGYGMMLPKHVLESVPLSEWRDHPFNNGKASYTVGSYTAYGPIGTGPYWYAAYDPSTFANILSKNDNYWNKAALESAGTFAIKNYYVQWIEESDPAIAGLKSGDIDVLDSQYHVENKITLIEAPWGATVSYDAYGVQELGFNMRHPVIGTGVDTPLGKQDPSRAAEGARYVRQAMSHLIPRQDIIDEITNGYGSLGVTTPVTRVTAGFDTSLEPYTYDITLAKSLLAGAGYETGVAPPAGDIWGQYGIYIVAVVVIVVIAGVAVVVLRRRKPS
jgi:ABC-type transport system substrate-binding protein